MRVNLPSNSLLCNKRNIVFTKSNENKSKSSNTTLKQKAQELASSATQAPARITTALKDKEQLSKIKAATRQEAGNLAHYAVNIPSTVTSAIGVRKYQKLFSPEAETIYNRAIQIARTCNSEWVESKHFWLASLMETYKFLKEIDEGKAKYDQDCPRHKFLYMMLNEISEEPSLDINEDKTRKKVKKVILKYIKKVKEDFEQEVKEKPAKEKPSYSSAPVPSKSALKELEEVHNMMVKASDGVETFYDSYFYMIAANSTDRNLKTYYEEFLYDLEKALMIDDPEEESKFHLGFYDEKADSLWKTVDMGKDAIVLCEHDNDSSIKYLRNSFENLIKKPGKSYRNLNKDNTEIITLNNYADLEFMHKLIKEKSKANAKTGKTTIIIREDLAQTMALSSIGTIGETGVRLGGNSIKVLANTDSDDNKNSNVRLIFTTSPAIYEANMNNMMSRFLGDYTPLELSEITSSEAKEYLTDEKGLEFVKNKLGKNIDKKAIQRAIELTNDKQGNYPDKAMNLLNRVSNYFIESDSVSEEQVLEYIKQMQQLTESQDTEDEGTIIYNTHKTLSDIAGSQMTRDAAQAVVDEIKNNPQTKGYLIYQSRHTSNGGGRRNTAEAIAGEAQIPMIVINAKEFLQKDFVSLSNNPNFAEQKMKKIIAKVKTQAKATPNQTAMIFIENFDEFATDPYKGYPVDTYAQKAFSQLLDEMKKAQSEKSVNIIVMGSVNYPQVIDDNIKKPGRFMDKIVVYPPQDEDETEKVIRYLIERENKFNIMGDKEQQDEIIKFAALTASRFSVVNIMNMLETALSVSIGRGKSAIDKADITEAYLRTTSGIVRKSRISDHRKKIVTSHEAGHALTAQIMYNIAKKQEGQKWTIPDRLNFITLDPRGDYGGAMYPVNNENEEYSFEKIMADLICDYGGHSSEKVLYRFTGSWGISEDMLQARYLAEEAVTIMGMGPTAGVRHYPRDIFGKLDVTEKQKQMIADDEEKLLSTAETISDMIIEKYQGFIQEFTDRHWEKVCTGECIITSEEFNQELNDWIEAQSPETRDGLEKLEGEIIKLMNEAKYGNSETQERNFEEEILKRAKERRDRLS